jgi:2'-5' RNA ligase
VSAAAERGPRKLRLFFALWPGERERAALWAAARPAVERVAGEAVSPGNLHVTLAFLGSVPGQTFANLVQLGGQGPWPAVEISFARIEYWVRPKVLVALATAVPPAGQEIVDRLWTGLEALGFARELRPWRPHLTLVRRVRRRPPDHLEMAPVEGPSPGKDWRLALVESAAHPDGTRYRPLADWPLESTFP